LIIQTRDGSLVHEQRHLWPQRRKRPNYCVELPAPLLDALGSLIDQIISFAFDTLGALRLEVRVHESE
jgi:hypothetical protein